MTLDSTDTLYRSLCVVAPPTTTTEQKVGKKGMIAHIAKAFFSPLATAVAAFNFHIFMRGCFMARYNILSCSVLQDDDDDDDATSVGGTFEYDFVATLCKVNGFNE